ncbi:LacI family transcriptional regulator [Capsulimonas corticalis]|uniref:LacI family transcriptional regulator n=1 Tax=Capsulimonas corticalis TaxID=2219043 RepID=A0A402D683_9BACT|nr:LacI family DNA-binding transcriptional regulator [Capsulimonas corticalis]BDI32074.1 LacI family transcriptional regulator [Capsulimonas corticalis]
MNIVEFAKCINVSSGTVSRALNDRPDINPKTRQMVLEKAQELGFTRNASAHQLVTGRTFLIRLECPYNADVLSDRYLIEMARALESETRAHNYNLLLRLGRRPEGAETDMCMVDGLVLMSGPEVNADDMKALTRNWRTPTVIIDGPDQSDFPKASHICVDTVPGVRKALQYFANLGHKRVGYIGSGFPESGIRVKLPALMAEAGLAWDPSLAIEAGVTSRDGFEATHKLLQLDNPPTALLARTDVLAFGAIEAANSLGLSVPKEISVIGHDNVEIAALASPPLTTIAIDIPQVARAAIRALIGMIEDNAEPAMEVCGAHLVVRRSCAPSPI